MVIDGLYSVSFQTPLGEAGGGVVVFRGAKAQGGDAVYYYDSQFTESSVRKIDATVTVRKHGTGTSVFGDIPEFTLHLEGTADGPQFVLAGAIAGQPAAKITVRCKRLAD